MQRFMPEHGAAIPDADTVDLLKFIRWHFNDRPPWENVAGQVSANRPFWQADRLRPPTADVPGQGRNTPTASA